jgi:hypothetical protein
LRDGQALAIEFQQRLARVQTNVADNTWKESMRGKMLAQIGFEAIPRRAEEILCETSGYGDEEGPRD